MPAKYMIHAGQTPDRFETVTKSGIIAWEEGCLKCAVCVKKRCVYRVYEKRGLDALQMVDSVDNQCMNCLRCVQGCPKELIHKSVSPEYKALGDEYWSAEIISKIWYQARTGKIPVSGAGYPGPFSGAGFDSMWTDMSEIVRPTRDGIHGREYISTAVDLGGTPRHLSFGIEGALEVPTPKVIDMPLPVLLRVPSVGRITPNLISGWAVAARRLGIFLALGNEHINAAPGTCLSSLMPVVEEESLKCSAYPGTKIMELIMREDTHRVAEMLKTIKEPEFISVRIPVSRGVDDRALALAKAGLSIIHLEGTDDGRFLDDPTKSIKDGIRSTHLRLVEAGLRDAVTLLASGGMAMAEHVPKSLICGADAVFVDIPILVALECRLCGRCGEGLPCPVKMDKAEPVWVARRVVNLMAAWHSQLLEVMGAMGIRDARRLRGEAGRAMFFEELDRSTFANLGKTEEGCELE
ncbi:MAG: hypothetical protein C4582_11910 [Desulfobacteraceae bacterium]|jgi:ferredoxin|nr:MAG: hypothetical protein C4582_11910 [Desulfobacteraceae bacterium]